MLKKRYGQRLAWEDLTTGEMSIAVSLASVLFLSMLENDGQCFGFFVLERSCYRPNEQC